MDLYGDLFEEESLSNSQANATSNTNDPQSVPKRSDGGEIPTPVTTPGQNNGDCGSNQGHLSTVVERRTEATSDSAFLEEILSLDSHKDIELRKVRCF